MAYKTRTPGSYPMKIYSPSMTSKKGTMAAPPTPQNTGWPTTVPAGTGPIGSVNRKVMPTGHKGGRFKTGGKGTKY